MTAISARTRSTLRATVTIVVAAALYEAVARTGYFPPALMPTLPKVWNALIGSLARRHHDLRTPRARSIACWSGWRSRSRSACRSAS